MDIREEAGNHHFESIAGNGPGRMLAAGTGAEVAASDEDFAPVAGVVQDEVRIRRSVRAVPPVTEQVVPEKRLVPRGRLQEAGGNDLVRVHVLERKRDAGALYDVEFLFHSSSLGSVMTPVTAAAAAVSGLARSVREPGP